MSVAHLPLEDGEVVGEVVVEAVGADEDEGEGEGEDDGEGCG